MNMIEQFDVVRLMTDRYQKRGVRTGALGTVLEVYDDAYEVEFSRPDGITIDWFPVRFDEVERVAATEAIGSEQHVR